jgi:hypothetical protein
VAGTFQKTLAVKPMKYPPREALAILPWRTHSFSVEQHSNGTSSSQENFASMYSADCDSSSSAPSIVDHSRKFSHAAMLRQRLRHFNRGDVYHPSTSAHESRYYMLGQLENQIKDTKASRVCII